MTRVETVKDVCKAKGLPVLASRQGTQLAETFLPGSIQRTIEGHLKTLKSARGAQTRPEYAWMSRVDNLYDLACYFCGDSGEKAPEYHRKGTLKLAFLQPLFCLLRDAPMAFRKEPRFAENCISRITKYFPDRNLALALYNREAGLTDSPYEPETSMLYLTYPS